MKFLSPKEQANARRNTISAGHSPAPKKAARKPYNNNAHFVGIIESKLAPYIDLICGHITTRDDVILTSSFRPSQKDYWCDKCGKWVLKKLAPVYEIPDEPMF